MYNSELEDYDAMVSLFEEMCIEEADDDERHMMTMNEKGKRRKKIRRDWNYSWRRRDCIRGKDEVLQLIEKLRNRADRIETARLTHQVKYFPIDEMETIMLVNICSEISMLCLSI